jgi:hypothetical protein
MARFCYTLTRGNLITISRFYSARDVLNTSRRGSLFDFIATTYDTFIVKCTYKLFVYN